MGYQLHVTMTSGETHISKNVVSLPDARRAADLIFSGWGTNDGGALIHPEFDNTYANVVMFNPKHVETIELAYTAQDLT